MANRATAAGGALAGDDLAQRMGSTRLTPPERFASVPAEVRFPSWLAGTWQVTNTAVGLQTPLGRRFVDPYILSVAQRDVGSKSTMEYQLRFIEDGDASSPMPVRQDRPFNSIEEEGALVASRGVVIERGDYKMDASYPHGRVLLELKDEQLDRVASAELPKGSPFNVRRVVRTQLELETVWAQWQDGSTNGNANAFFTSELMVQRVLLPLTTAPREAKRERVLDASYLEILTRFERSPADMAGTPPTRLRARNRVVQYLSLPGVSEPAAALEVEAAGRAVLLLDYDWDLRRLV